jgi:hypothetical protein
MFTLCYWPAPLSCMLYLGYGVWYEVMGQGLVYRLWLCTAVTGCRILGATLVRYQRFTVIH